MRSVADQMGRTVDVVAFPQRIISLVPSQTELLYHLGLADRVVGITKFCVHPKEWFRSKERIGGTKKLNLEKICELRPDLIIGNKEENDEKQIKALMQAHSVWISDVTDLSSALEMVEQIGDLVNARKNAHDIWHDISSSFQELVPFPAARQTLYLIWRGPWMAAGSDTFINDMLQRMGCVNVAAGIAARYPQLDQYQVRQLNPEIVMLSSEPYPFKEEHVAELRDLLPKAQFHLVNGEYFSWYGSRLLRSVSYLQDLQHSLRVN